MLVVKNLPAMQERQESWARSPGGRSPGGGNDNLAWKIPWAEEPGALQSMGSQRIRYD